MGEKPKLELSQCQLCGNLSSNVYNELQVDMKGQFEEGPAAKEQMVKVSLSFSDEEDKPQILCWKCATLLVSSLAIQMQQEHEALEAATDEHIDKH